MQSSFGSFTRKYALSKTLRFELKPVRNTEKMLIDNGIFSEDGIRKEKYEKVKRYFDRFHREFVEASLKDVELEGLDSYFIIFQKWQKDKKDKQLLLDLQKKEKALRKSIVNAFDTYADKLVKGKYKHLKLKNSNIDILFEEGVFAILSDRYGLEEEAHFLNEETGEIVTIFDDWKGFVGYFKKFFETRKNFYQSDGKATAIATRAIDQNLRRFCDNLVTLEKLKEKIEFSEVENNFGKSVEAIFDVDAYDTYILQNGIDLYNRIIGGETMENGEKKKGINELINKYRQDYKGEKLPFLKTLDKQILSEKEKRSFGIESEDQLFEVLSQFLVQSSEKISLLRNLFDAFIDQNDNFDREKVYLSREALNTITYRWMDDGDSFEKSLFDVFKKVKDNSAKYKKEDNSYSFPDFISIRRIEIALESGFDQKTFWKSRYYRENDKQGILSGDETLSKQFFLILRQEFERLFRNNGINQETRESYEGGYDISCPKFEQFLKSETRKINQETKVVIKDFSDDVLHIYQMGKYFSLEKKRVWNMEYEMDSLFYTHPETGYMLFYVDAYETIVQKYNDIRNYLTKKPYSEEKWKLNFENGSDFLGGWDQNQETKKYGTILRKDDKYYLGIFKKKYRNDIFRKEESGSWSRKIDQAYDVTSECYEKMEYKSIADASKDISLLLSRASEQNLRLFDPSERVLKIKETASFKKGDQFNLQDLHYLIDYYKTTIPLYRNWQFYKFSFSDTEVYKNITEFTDEIARDGYKLWFEKISATYIEEKNDAGELYLFEIYNQDFATGKTGKKNLHTMYWEGLFSVENMKEFPLKLNGEAEIFYRPKSIEVEKEKRCKSGREITKNKRYTEDKIFFHCPITLNRGKGEVMYFNQHINEMLSENPGINVIGVDRGEKHLAYYSVINQHQEILESGSLNVINGVDYDKKLAEKSKNRKQAYKDWQSVEAIKELKKGYVSQVVHTLVDLAIKYNAIIVLEDLNMRFKQIRGGIEKSIYQKLEKALIDKLAFLVMKGERDPEKAGHLLNAYQLTAPFESFQKMGKQTGILFYTQASYTSKIDPLTGWRPNLYLKYSNAKKAQGDIQHFSSIIFNKEKNRFEFTYDVKSFQTLKQWPKNTVWTICSCVERFRWNRTLNQNKGDYDHYADMTESFKKLFGEYHIDRESDIKKQIEVLPIVGNEKFFKDFIFFFNLICQIRNTDPKKEKNDPLGDFILSPVEPFFDSRRAGDFGENLPKNGDDNGAYNIARKGLMILDTLNTFKKTGSLREMKWGDLYISQSDWDTFAQKKR